ncbi:hypothetical protein C1645_858305 [Glomus cerebriforme]|uniref:Uncharacterized protein n=1 Tax=Glomus cerebriforme TaxID=658196 RepID=A0A397SGB1_9GLOM|nr:hypothetical protein C1645_858305 [Glomus cerebriforme]
MDLVLMKFSFQEMILCIKFGIVRKQTGEFIGIPKYVHKVCKNSLNRMDH